MYAGEFSDITQSLNVIYAVVNSSFYKRAFLIAAILLELVI